MGFVNEIVSEEDIETHGLDDLYAEFSPLKWRDGRPATFKHAWTVDRERSFYFAVVKQVEETGPSGRSEPTQKYVCVLNCQGSRVLIETRRTSNSSVLFSDSPFRIVWELLAINTSQLPQVPREHVIGILKEALTVFGHRGAHRQVPNTVVQFSF